MAVPKWVFPDDEIQAFECQDIMRTGKNVLVMLNYRF